LDAAIQGSCKDREFYLRGNELIGPKQSHHSS